MVMTPEIFLHELWVASRITATVLCIIFAGYFWNRRRKTELKSTRWMLFAQGWFVFCFGLTRTLFAISDLFTDESYYQNVILYEDIFLSDLFWKLSTFIGVVGIIFLLAIIETYLVKSRYIFTIVAAIGMIVAIVSPDINISRLATYIALPISMVALIFLYFYLLYKGGGIIRKKAGLSIVGLFFLGAGTLLTTTAALDILRGLLGTFPEFIPVIILTVGLAIYTQVNITD